MTRSLSQDIDRRAALKLLASGLTLSLATCGKPFEEIVPYVDMPERVVPGEPMKFATALSLSGLGRGVLAISVDGRPIKIEGNPRHPASLGSTDVFAEAAIMSLYDPDRSKAPRSNDEVATWNAFAGALRAQMEQEQTRDGAGLRIVSGRWSRFLASAMLPLYWHLMPIRSAPVRSRSPTQTPLRNAAEPEPIRSCASTPSSPH
jgi:molybdopterin-containing oxidoreductase family iron-sulfur binding subunit